MKIFGMGIPELLIILVVVLLIFGPRNLPKLGSALGRTVRNLRNGMGGRRKEKLEESEGEQAAEEEVTAEVADEEPVVAAESKPAVKRVVKKTVKRQAE